MILLAEEFRRREMRSHLDHLRAYYRVYSSRKHVLAREKRPPWDEEMVIGWLCNFQIAPFESVFPTLGRGVPCPQCRADTSDIHRQTIRAVWPGGALRECWSCHARWLELEHTERRTATAPKR